MTGESRGRDVGFVGLGLMGYACVSRLLERGLVPSVFDVDPHKTQRAANLGAEPAASAAALASRSDVILMCVTSTAAVREAVFGANGVAQGATPGKRLVDHSTTDAPATREMAARLREDAGMGWVDAPVSGGPGAARTGQLAIMAGGGESDVGAVRPVLDELAATVTHFGPVGAGQVAKMVNQVLVLNNYCVLAEALALAEAGGIDAAKIPGALAAGHAGSNMLAAVFPRLVERDFEPKGYARQVLKDLDMLQALARELGVPTPMSSQAASLYRVLNAKGHAELDAIAVLKVYDPGESL